MSAPADPQTLEQLRRRVAADPADDAAQYALGTALWWAGAREAAVAHLAGAVALRPDDADARTNLGNALAGLGRPAEAVPHLEAAAELRPGHAPAQYNLGNALQAAGRPAEAEARFRAALHLTPDHVGAHNNLGNALRALGRLEEALACYRQAATLQPDLAGAHNNVGSVLLALHRPEDAVAPLRQALRLNPDYAEACDNLGGALLAMGQPEQALVPFRRAVALDAAQVQAAFGESLALLTLGRFGEGWEKYESRWLDPRFCEGERTYAMPLWRDAAGADIAGRTVLLHAEQGLGDTIQFVRYAPLVRRLGARVVLEVQAPLVGLLRDLADCVIAAGAELPRYDLHCPLLSLPLAFRSEVPTIPAAVPYLRADPACRAAWEARLGPRRGLQVGLVVSGSPEQHDDALRSIPAALFAPLLAVPGVAFHVVQKELRAPDAAFLGAAERVRIHADLLTDFRDTAALLGLLDLLVSVDTSVAHLGGALGMPVWLLLQRSADFRWMRVREDSPWYPTVRLFRQTTPLRWEPVLARVAQALRERVAQAQ